MLLLAEPLPADGLIYLERKHLYKVADVSVFVPLECFLRNWNICLANATCCFLFYDIVIKLSLLVEY